MAKGINMIMTPQTDFRDKTVSRMVWIARTYISRQNAVLSGKLVSGWPIGKSFAMNAIMGKEQ